MMFALLTRIVAPLWRDAAGNAAIELAFAMPILLLLVLVAADYASLANQTVNLQAATRSAAQYARGFPNASGATLAAYGNFPAGVTPSVSTFCTCVNNVAVTCSGSCSGTDTRIIKYVQVSATQPFSPWFSYAGLTFPQSLSASVALRMQ
jgi:Flp pilus assembly protein TadG